MNEIKVDWKLAPVDATELVKVCNGGQRWRNPKTKQYWEMNGDFAGYYSERSPLDEAKVLATRPQRKTVADAVEWINAGNEIIEEDGGSNDFLSYRKSKGSFEFVSSGSIAGSDETELWQPICPREQFEAYVKANDIGKILESRDKQEGDKWTHTCTGHECKLLADKHDLFNRMPIQYKGGDYGLVHISDLKPIKPKLTKEQSEALIEFSSEVGSFEITAEVESYLKKYS